MLREDPANLPHPADTDGGRDERLAEIREALQQLQGEPSRPGLHAIVLRVADLQQRNAALLRKLARRLAAPELP
jgi:hypothetical protein